jgi:Beta-propeller repeat
MKTKSTFQSAPFRLPAREDFRSSIGEGGFSNLRALIAVVVAFAGVFLALFATAMRPPSPVTQAWVARYNGPGNLDDGGHAIVGDNSGNVYVTGGSHGLGTDLDYATIKYDSAGQQQWVARFNGLGNGWDRAAAIARDSAGNLYVTGQSLGLGTGYDYATVKYDSAGQELWVARYNGPGNGEDDAVAIAVDGSGNVYVTGVSLGLGTGYDYATIKYDSAGQEQWVVRYSLPASDLARAIAVDGSGNVYVTGRSTGLGTLFDYATIKYDSAGQEQWVARYNGPANDYDDAFAVAVDSLGNVYVTGTSLGAAPYSDYATVKYDSAGQEQWVARYPGPIARAIAVDSSGNVYVTGESAETQTSNVAYATIKYDSAGQQQWVARYDGHRKFYARAQAIALDGSANVYVTGFSAETRSYDYATVKYNSAGQQQWVAIYNGPGHGDDDAQALTVDGSGNVYVTGNSPGRRTGYDYATIKYVQNPP